MRDPESSELISAKAEIYQGEYPSGKMFQEYEEAIPGLGGKIFDLIKSEAEYRREIRKNIIAKTYSERKLGQILGLVISLAFLGCSTFLIYTGHNVAGTIMGSSTIVSLVAVFVLGRKQMPDRSIKEEGEKTE